MNKVLIICSNFPPVRNGGTIRCEKLAKYLPAFGWETVVLTKIPSQNQKLDLSLNLEFCKVYRTRSRDLATTFTNIRDYCKRFFKRHISRQEKKENVNTQKANSDITIKRRIVEYFLIPDSDIFWAIGSFLKGIFILRKEKPVVIFSSGPSHSVHIIGLLLKLTSNKKWIIEFRDPWTMNPFNIPKPYKLLTIIDNYFENIILKKADSINVTSEVYKYQFQKKYNCIDNRKIIYIPNGYDPEDFDNQLVNENKSFTIVHTGNFYQHRSSSLFIEAIISLLKNELLNPDKILVKFIGLLDEKGKYLIENSKFSYNFQITGQVPHKESIYEICNADLLLLIPGPGEGTMPGKFFEYLATSKPIFCMANEGPAKELINKHHLGLVSSDNDVKEITNKLMLLINDIIEGKFIYPNVDELKKQFNRKNIAGQMAHLFNGQIE